MMDLTCGRGLTLDGYYNCGIGGPGSWPGTHALQACRRHHGYMQVGRVLGPGYLARRGYQSPFPGIVTGV